MKRKHDDTVVNEGDDDVLEDEVRRFLQSLHFMHFVFTRLMIYCYICFIIFFALWCFHLFIAGG